MAKTIADAVYDAALQYIEDNTTLVTVCSAQPTTYTEASATYKLADVVTSATDFTGPANGDVSGRKETFNGKTGVTVDSSGTATYVAGCNSAGTALLWVTTCTSQVLTAGNTVDIPAIDLEIADPS
jgi:hypothetical protein